MTTIDDTMRNALVAAATALLNGGDLQILTAGGALAKSIASAGTAASYRLRSASGAVRVSGGVAVIAVGDPAPDNALGLLTLTLTAGMQIDITSFSYRQPATL